MRVELSSAEFSSTSRDSQTNQDRIRGDAGDPWLCGKPPTYTCTFLVTASLGLGQQDLWTVDELSSLGDSMMTFVNLLCSIRFVLFLCREKG